MTLRTALADGNCDRFGEAVYQYGLSAGRCFAKVQGGPFATAETERLVNAIREHGIQGVGQSSWGPTVFAITRDAAAANALRRWLREDQHLPDDRIRTCEPNNTGRSLLVHRPKIASPENASI